MPKVRLMSRAWLIALTLTSLVAAAALAAPITGAFTGLGPYSTITGTFNGSPASYNGGAMKLTIDGVTVGSFCTDLRHGISNGDTLVSTEATMDCRITWLLMNYPPRLSGETYPDNPPTTPLSNQGQEMAARQAAVWYFSDGFLPASGNTVGDRAWQIINSVPADACAALDADVPVLSVQPAASVKTVGDNVETFTVTATRGGSPVSGLTLHGSTNFGALDSAATTTDLNGQGVFTLTNTGGVTGTANFVVSATVDLPVGTIFEGSPNAEKQKLVLGKLTPGSIFGSGSVTWQSSGSIVAHVFHDRNLDGVQTGAEDNLQNWSIQLYQWNGSSWVLQSTQTTNASGLTSFTGLDAGLYRVDETLQSGWLATTLTSRQVSVGADAEYVEFGVVRAPVVVARKFNDADLDGAQDAGEADLAGWTMTLYRADGSAILGATGATGADGKVVLTFDRASDFVAGNYYVEETQQPLWFATTGASQSFSLASGAFVTVTFGNAQAQPDVLITKSVPAQAHVGDVLTFTYTVENTGNVALDDVSVADPLAGGAIDDCSRSSLAVGASYTCTATHTITAGDADPLGSTATVSGTDSFGQTATDTDSASTDILHPAINVTISAPASVSVGSTITYLITVENTGDAALSGVSVTDSLTGFSWSGSLAAGASQSFTATYTPTPADAGTLVNNVSASGQDALSQSVTDGDSASTLVTLPDADGDGIPDYDEGGGDTDGDGTPDYQDTDADGDNIPDDTECPTPAACRDTDSDGTPDYRDTDSDGDNISDDIECPNPVACRDTDSDGTPDYRDTDSDGDNIPDDTECPNPAACRDTDSDSTPDYRDTDSDGDNISDDTECPNPAACRDTDSDGTPDYRDTDSDGDNISDDTECPNPAACRDTDSDGTPDYRDTDSDGDSLPDNLECLTPSSCQDTDSDGTPDYRDTDSDGDNLSDTYECPSPAGCRDTDSDGTPDYRDTDSDNDQLADSLECPELVRGSCRDTDSDGSPDYRDTDSDGDGILDTSEYSSSPADDLIGCTANSPTCNNNDVDGDGLPNFQDIDSDGDGILDSVEGAGDSDNDGIPNYLDNVNNAPPSFKIFLPVIYR